MQLHAIEVAIAVVASYFLISVMASAAVELVGLLTKKRAKDLLVVLNQMIDGDIVLPSPSGAPDSVTGPTAGMNETLEKRLKTARRARHQYPPTLLAGTSGWTTALAAARAKRGIFAKGDTRTPSYLSARAFADATVEGLLVRYALARTATGTAKIPWDSELPSGLKRRLTALVAESDDLVAVKAGLENWFDDAMERLEGAYKRWSQWILLAAGLLFAGLLNVSTARIAASTWRDTTLSAAVASAADKLVEGGSCSLPTTSTPTTATTSTSTTSAPDGTGGECESPARRIEASIDDLDGLRLPLGWSAGWDKAAGGVWTILGIVPTALAVLLGAPFWFDLLTKLTGARRARGEPPKAADDPASATAALGARTRSGGSNAASQPFKELLAGAD